MLLRTPQVQCTNKILETNERLEVSSNCRVNRDHWDKYVKTIFNFSQEPLL